METDLFGQTAIHCFTRQLFHALARLVRHPGEFSLLLDTELHFHTLRPGCAGRGVNSRRRRSSLYHYSPSRRVPHPCAFSQRKGWKHRTSCERIASACRTAGALPFFRLAQLGDDREVFQRRRVALDLAVRGQFPQQPAHDLAGAGLGQRLGEADVVGPGQRANLL